MKIKLIYIKKYFLLISFVIFILVLSLVSLISKDKNFSEFENRYLQTKPKFTFKKFINNEFSVKYEQFINDQFCFRDNWINIKMFFEIMLMKVENNSIIIGKDNYLFDKLISINQPKVNENISYIVKLARNMPKKKIWFTLIPNSYEILKNKLPLGEININQTREINNIYENFSHNNLLNLNFIDGVEFLQDKTDKIYYCTDHHWTTLGAYYFYYNLSNILNYKPVKLTSLNRYEIDNFYGTYYSKAKILWKKPDTIFYYDISIKSLNVDNKIYKGLYNQQKFKERDKYAGFIYGNNGLSIIECEKSKDKKDNILIIKDSYANSLIPFLTYNYNKIYVIDLRYIKSEDIKELMVKYEIEDILIIYNFINFISDSNINKIIYLY